MFVEFLKCSAALLILSGPGADVWEIVDLTSLMEIGRLFLGFEELELGRVKLMSLSSAESFCCKKLES